MSFCFIVHSCFLFYFYLQHDIICACASAFYYAITIFLQKKKKSSQGHFIKKVFFSPTTPSSPPRHVSCEKARWRAVQEPTVPGLSIYNDPRSHKPLPSQWITFSNSTHSKFIYLQLVCAHTLVTHTHTLTPRVRRRGKGRRGVLSPWSAADKNAVPSFANSPWSVQYNGMHACMRARTRLPARLPWSEASMLTVLKSWKWVKIKGEKEKQK